MKVEVYSDIQCPWCYVGKARFEKALEAFPQRDQVEVVYKAYQLNPDLPTDPAQAVPHDEYLTARFGPGFKQMSQNLAQVAAKEGLDFHTEKSLIVNTFNGHRLLTLAEREGGADLKQKLATRLFKAQFTNGENVADPERLAEIAGEVGIDAQKARDYLASNDGADVVSAEINEARAMGITGVPTFVFEGKWGVSGAQEAETFLKILEQVSQEIAATPAEGDAPACEGDSCEV
jgi:predicted DsbA family dithiol-disulfide isomerase